MTHERLERRMEEAEEREAKRASREHRAQPLTDRRGVLLCAICGEAVRQWPDGRFPIHARAHI